MTSILLIGAQIHSPTDPFADALLIVDGQIAWLGQREAAARHDADRIVDLQGALITPAFVDAHVHATSAGLALIGLDLSAVRSAPEALNAIAAESRRLRGAPLVGHGWDESQWPEGRALTRAELDRATHGSVVYLSRRDVHSALVSSALVAAVPDLPSLAGYSDSGPLTAAAHGAARQAVMATVAARRRAEAQLAFLEHCASVGIVAIHECAGPIVSSAEDLIELAQNCTARGIDLTRYWGEAGKAGIDAALELGARPGGDLFVDGSLGSHTAWLNSPYADRDSTGNVYLTIEQIETHLQIATSRGVQAGFHAIGDGALQAIMDAASRVSALQPEAFKALGHRIEHVEMASDPVIERMVGLGMIASVQPSFDWLWGGANSMYATRLGADRAAQMNHFASWTRAGLPIAFGSDAPVTPAAPWEWIRAALFHSNAAERMTARAAFAAATRGGWRAAGRLGEGVIAPGAVARLAVWDAERILVQTPDARMAAWSTDERAGTPGLPEITLTGAVPTCLATINGDRVLHSHVDALPCQ